MSFRLPPHLHVALGPLMILGGIGIALEMRSLRPGSTAFQEIASPDRDDLAGRVRADDAVFLGDDAAPTHGERSDREHAPGPSWKTDELYASMVRRWRCVLSEPSDASRTWALAPFERGQARDRLPGFFAADRDALPRVTSLAFSSESDLGGRERTPEDLRRPFRTRLPR